MCCIVEEKKKFFFFLWWVVLFLFLYCLSYWLDGVLPMVMDQESGAQEKCLQLLDDVLLNNITDLNKYGVYLMYCMYAGMSCAHISSPPHYTHRGLIQMWGVCGFEYGSHSMLI